MAASTLPKSEVLLHAREWIAGIGDLEDESDRREFFGQDPETEDLAALIHSEVLRFAYADVERAGRLAQASGWLARVRADDTSRAFHLRCQGHVHFARGQHAEAVRNYGAAIDLLERRADDLDVGRTLNSGLQALIYLGEYDRAFEWAERARLIFSRHGDELRLARLASNMGNILFRQDRHAEAMEYYRSAREPLGRLGEPRDLAAVLSNMAVCCTSLRR